MPNGSGGRQERAANIEGLGVSYGAVPRSRDVSMSVDAGEAVALIGANGAGKSHACSSRSSASCEPRERPSISPAGHARAGPERRVRLGIGYAPEGRRVFPGLTVRENLEVAASRRKAGRAKGWTRLRAVSAARRAPRRAGLAVFRRSAADARHRPRAHGPAASSSARRALARPFAEARGRGSAAVRVIIKTARPRCQQTNSNGRLTYCDSSYVRNRQSVLSGATSASTRHGEI